MSREPGVPRVHRSSLRVLAGGVLLIAAYAVLAALTTIGDPGDIGGGLILLLGYLTTAAGLFLVGHDLWESRPDRD
jgi:fatty acid desaturase